MSKLVQTADAIIETLAEAGLSEQDAIGVVYFLGARAVQSFKVGESQAILHFAEGTRLACDVLNHVEEEAQSEVELTEDEVIAEALKVLGMLHEQAEELGLIERVPAAPEEATSPAVQVFRFDANGNVVEASAEETAAVRGMLDL